MSLRRAALALLLFAMIAAAFGACTPFGDDDDDDETDAAAATPTREVVMATFTATEVVPPDQQTATAEAQQTAAAATQAARASLPTPTAAATVEDLLYPPRTRLETPGELVDSYLGTYSWQYSDDDQTYAAIEAPIVVLERHDPTELQNGDNLSIRYYGDEYRTPPAQLEVAIYDFESNSAVPSSSQATGDEPAFAIKTDPVQNLRVDPADPSFTLQGFPPGHYVIWAQGRWGQHPALDRQLFVTWVFDIEITE
ncbi:MAG: hypothetical protein R3A46_04370 [Thermomicrobiales bacterium]